MGVAGRDIHHADRPVIDPVLDDVLAQDVAEADDALALDDAELFDFRVVIMIAPGYARAGCGRRKSARPKAT